MEAVVEQGELFPVIEEKTKRRSLFRRYVAATLEHGPLATPAMCAAAIGLSRQRIHQFIQDGRISIIDFDGHKFIPASEFERFLCDERANGRHLEFQVPETQGKFIRSYIKHQFQENLGK